MCWSKRSSPDVSTIVTTTTLTPEESTAANDTLEYCRYPAVECSQDLNDGYCSSNGKCCELDSTTKYCVCFSGYTEKYCQSRTGDPWVLESLEANTTIGIAVGVGSLLVMVLIALLAFFIVMHLKKIKNKRQDPADLPMEQVDLRTNSGNNVNGISPEEAERMISDSNHNNPKPTSE